MNARLFDDEDALMVAARLADVDDLNRRARQALRDEGYLGDDRVVLAGRGFAEGDDVLALRNDYRLGLLNGTRAVIEQIDTSRHQMTLGTDTGEQLVVPFAYAEAGHLTHGYATTIHKAQGATVDRCLVLLDDTTSREHAYTALSRGRHGNDLFVVAEDRRSEERHAAEIERDPLDDLRQAIRRSAGKRMALDEIEPPPASTLDQLRRERDDAPPPTRRRPTRPVTGVPPALRGPRPGAALPRRSAVAARHRTQGTSTTSARSAAAPTEPSDASSSAASPASRRHRPPRREARRPRGEARRAHARDADP